MEMKKLKNLELTFSVMNDWLSIYFGFLIILIFIPVFIYSIGYIKAYKKNYSIEYLWGVMLLFVISMLGVLLSGDGITFMVFWEIMSITSFFLIIYEFKNKENLKSGIIYFIMTHISGLILMVMFAFIYKYMGSMDFKNIITSSKNIESSEKLIIFILALTGFGAKAALIPLHAWLPKAYPSAPSNITALMSGAMTKVALYGFIRVSFMFLGNMPMKFGVTVMVLGIISAIFSVLNAMFQDDIKRLLAYSSAENIGIIFGALGLAMVFGSFNLYELQAITLAAALFHILNHSVFKSLLFLCAGSVLYATSSKNMNELGGIYNKMKFATYCAFVGTAAMSAIPPLNGFASEILIFKSFIQAATSIENIEIVFLVILCGIILAMTCGAVIYTSIKSFGITYLGAARSDKAIRTQKIPMSMNIGMGILALYCILLGIFSSLAIKRILELSRLILGFVPSSQLLNHRNEVIIVSIILIAVTAILFLINRSGDKNTSVEICETWGCGFNNVKPLMQYTGSGYTQPAARFLGNITGYKKEVSIKEKVYLKQRTVDIIEKHLYSRIVKCIDYISSKIIKIHHGKIQSYVSYLFVSLIITLIMVIKLI
jgi:hydrogenase-4 component B